jgi:hypothetical protein
MPCSPEAVAGYRAGSILPDNSPPIIGGARYDNCPILPDNVQQKKRLQASKPKVFSHYRRETHKPIAADNSQISGAVGVYKTPPPIWPIRTACAEGL